MPDIDTSAQPQPQQQLPSSRTLLRSTAIAAAVAAALLVAVVLPAEYGVDPTGVGRVLGLTRMGEIKVALAREAAADAAADSANANAANAARLADAPQPSAAPSAPSAASDSVRSLETRVALQAGEGKELKLVMRKGARATYSWTAAPGGVNFLTHGDTANAPANAYHTYGRGTAARADSGEIVAVFDCMHGWFWRNRTSGPVTVTLRTSGAFQEVKHPE